METLTGLEKEILRREEELSRLRKSYKESLRFAGDFDYAPVVETLFSYKSGESPEKAIFVLAKCQTMLAGLHEAFRSIRYFDNKEESLENLKAVKPVEQQEKF